MARVCLPPPPLPHCTWVRSIFQTSHDFVENVFITLLITMKVDAVEITTHIINGRLRATNEMRVKNFHNQKGRRNCHRLVKTCTVALPEAKEMGGKRKVVYCFKTKKKVTFIITLQ